MSSNIPFSLVLLGPSWSQAEAGLADKKMSAILVSNSGIIMLSCQYYWNEMLDSDRDINLFPWCLCLVQRNAIALG